MAKSLYHFSDVVFPIVKVKINSDSKAEFVRFLGSGFFIGNDGYFLTANHVLSEKLFQGLKEREILAIQHLGNSIPLTRIDYIEDHYEKLDVTLGHTNFKPLNQNFFNITVESESFGWEDVHVYGYPEFLVEDIPSKGHFLKGYITREIKKGENTGTIKSAPPSYALSFPIPKGMSGSPLFKTGKGHPLVGICIGSFEISTIIWENAFYEDPSEKLTERTQRVIENGLAIKIADIKDWKIKQTNSALEDLF